MALLLDLRHLARNLRRAPVSAAAAVLTLSLTLGAGASVFAVVDAVLLTPPPFSDPEALFTIEESPLRDPIATRRAAVPYATFERWRDTAGRLARLEAFDGTNLTLTGIGPAERVSVVDATPGVLPLLGVVPLAGRAFEPADIGQPVVVLTHTFWRDRFGSDPNVLGRRLLLGNQPHTIIGILPERFVFAIETSDLWRALPVTRAAATQAGYAVRVLARLADNASPGMLSARLDEVSRESTPPARVAATPITAQVAGTSVGTLGILAAASATAAIVAFINLSGLLLVRSVERRKELAVRTAVGARPSETAKQLLLEAFALVGCGFAGGVLLAAWMTPVVARLALEFGGLANQNVTVSLVVARHHRRGRGHLRRRVRPAPGRHRISMASSGCVPADHDAVAA